MELAIRSDELALERRVAPDERVDRVADRRAVDLDGPLAAGLRPQDLWQSDRAHEACPPNPVVPPSTNG